MAVIFEMVDTIGWQCFNIASITSAVIYLGLVIIGYVTEGPRYQMKWDFTKPFNSIGRVLIGIGVRALALFLRVFDVILAPLYEASAQVGEWLTEQGSTETQTRYRSRFI
jgi:hypothetical protein